MGIILPMYIKKTIFTTQYAALNILKLNTSVFSLLFCSSLCDLTIRSQAERGKSLLQEYIIHESCSGSLCVQMREVLFQTQNTRW